MSEKILGEDLLYSGLFNPQLSQHQVNMPNTLYEEYQKAQLIEAYKKSLQNSQLMQQMEILQSQYGQSHSNPIINPKPNRTFIICYQVITSQTEEEVRKQFEVHLLNNSDMKLLSIEEINLSTDEVDNTVGDDHTIETKTKLK